MESNMISLRMSTSGGGIEKIVVYSSRWITLALYFIMQLTNSTMWVSFSPISDEVSHFLNSSTYGNLTAINMLANLFLILYPFGTILAAYLMERYKLRISLVIAGASTILGGFLRIFAAYYRDFMSAASSYWMFFFGQALAAIVQPIYINYPPLVSALWFPVHERDFATTVGAMSNPIGNAIGTLIPTYLVSQSLNDDGSYTIQGMGSLMLVEFLMNLIPFIFLLWLIQDAPPTPPSFSTSLKLQVTNNRPTDDFTVQAVLVENLKLLATNRSYLVLVFGLSLLLGSFASMFTLLFQLLDRYNYSNNDAGVLGFITIIVGVCSSVVVAIVMKMTHAYRPLVQYLTYAAVPLFVLYFSVTYPDNFPAVCVCIAWLGLVIIPLLPVAMENCAECSYPVPEELSTGILFTCSNITGLIFTFILQYLAQVSDYSATPFTAANIFIFVFVILAAVIIFFYKGEYRRLHKDLNRKTDVTGVFNEDVLNVLDKAEIRLNPVATASRWKNNSSENVFMGESKINFAGEDL